MRNPRVVARAAIALGALALLLAFGEMLALLDIVQGKEADLSLEWTVVWLALPVVTLALVVLAAAVVMLGKGRPNAGRI